MAIDRKAYKADKKKYKKEVKTAKKVFKETGFKSYGNPFAPKRSDYKEADIPVVNDRRYEESARKERKNLLTENPVVNKSDDNENIGRGGKGPKPMSRTRRAKASLMKVKDGLVSRFQGSTPKIGKNKLMEPVVESIMPAMVKIAPDFPSMKQPLTKKMEKPKAISAKVKKK